MRPTAILKEDRELTHGSAKVLKHWYQYFKKLFNDWRNALIVPVPKKRHLWPCNNWHGICLLDVIGKIFARIIQVKLQVIAEGILPES